MKIDSPNEAGRTAAIPIEHLADDKTLSKSEKIAEASRQFEAVLLRQILGSARKTVFKSAVSEESLSSGIYQDMPGQVIEAAWAAPNALIAPSLGRNLAGNAATFSVPLVAPYDMLEQRIRRLDLRVSKTFKLPRKFNLQLNLDAYNALNNNAVQNINTAYGANWLQPLVVLDPQILQISGQITF